MKRNFRSRIPALLSAIALTTGFLLLGALIAQAKTTTSAKGENIFFYAKNTNGKSVLMKVIPLEELKAVSHGQLSDGVSGTDTGRNYYISTTDNYPTTQYCESAGYNGSGTRRIC